MTESSLSVSNETKIHISFQNDKNDNYEVARTEIIHTNQTGYVKDRFIGEAARSIIDVMEYTKQQNIPGILLF